MRKAWAAASPRYGAYALLMPGDPSFVCQAERCLAHCCKAFSVSLGTPEVTRLEQAGRAAVSFLEVVDGRPLELPLLRPYLLARREGQCGLLEGHRCSAYDGRPDACRRYPHEVLLVDREGRRAKPRAGDAWAAIHAIASPAPGQPSLVPLLLRHLECPGFDGPPLSFEAWLATMRETFSLQAGPPAPATTRPR